MDAFKGCARGEPRTTVNRVSLSEGDLHENLIDHLVEMQNAKGDKQHKLRATLDCILDLAQIAVKLLEAEKQLRGGNRNDEKSA